MRTIAVLLGLTAIGCRPSTPPEDPALAAAEARWDARAFPDYEMEMRISCHCSEEILEWNRVRVEGGKVTRVTRLSDSTVYASDRWKLWPSIDEIFERLHGVHDSDVYLRYTARFNPELGYPEASELFPDPNVLDLGIAWIIRSVVPIDTTHVP